MDKPTYSTRALDVAAFFNFTWPVARPARWPERLPYGAGNYAVMSRAGPATFFNAGGAQPGAAPQAHSGYAITYGSLSYLGFATAAPEDLPNLVVGYLYDSRMRTWAQVFLQE